jgi:hypothetical protein
VDVRVGPRRWYVGGIVGALCLIAAAQASYEWATTPRKPTVEVEVEVPAAKVLPPVPMKFPTVAVAQDRPRAGSAPAAEWLAR